jgi:uncharacterized membrane protein YhaH (DUF805 family)
MNKEKNIYNFKAPKSSNEEVNFFNIKGRINRKAFFVRLLLSIVIYFLFLVLFKTDFHKNFGFRFENFYETIHLFIFPLILSLFVLIQGAKRMHDINKSGWHFFIPFYNLYLAFLPGTKGNNDYGLDYNTTKDVTYFDELDDNQTKSNNSQINKNQNDKYFSFVIFFAFILLIVISAWYSSNNNNNSLPTNTTTDTTSIDTTWIDTSTSLNTTMDTINYHKIFNDNLLTPDEILEFGYGNNTKLRQINCNYRVLASEVKPVYFFGMPYKGDRKDAFFTTPEIVHANYESNEGFVYVEFTNSRGQESKGWLNISDLEFINNMN